MNRYPQQQLVEERPTDQYPEEYDAELVNRNLAHAALVHAVRPEWNSYRHTLRGVAAQHGLAPAVAESYASGRFYLWSRSETGSPQARELAAAMQAEALGGVPDDQIAMQGLVAATGIELGHLDPPDAEYSQLLGQAVQNDVSTASAH